MTEIQASLLAPPAMLALIAVATGLLASIAVVMLRAREISARSMAGTRQAQRDARSLILTNQQNLARLRSLGIEPEDGSVQLTPPIPTGDLLGDPQSIADDEMSEVEQFLAQDHADQLERILKDLRRIGDSKRENDRIAGFNLAIILALAGAAVVGFLTVETGVGAILLILAVIAIFLDLIFKLFQLGRAAALDAALQGVKNELEAKKARFEALAEQAGQG